MGYDGSTEAELRKQEIFEKKAPGIMQKGFFSRENIRVNVLGSGLN
jgi:hypothetical protein